MCPQSCPPVGLKGFPAFFVCLPALNLGASLHWRFVFLFPGELYGPRVGSPIFPNWAPLGSMVQPGSHPLKWLFRPALSRPGFHVMRFWAPLPPVAMPWGPISFVYPGLLPKAPPVKLPGLWSWPIRWDLSNAAIICGGMGRGHGAGGALCPLCRGQLATPAFLRSTLLTPR